MPIPQMTYGGNVLAGGGGGGGGNVDTGINGNAAGVGVDAGVGPNGQLMPYQVFLI